MTDVMTPVAATPLARALARLDAAGIRYALVEHRAAYTAAAEARAAGLDPSDTAKMVVLLEHDEVRLAVIPASRQLDLGRVRHVLQAGRHLRLATEAETADRFPAFDVGALPPMAADAVPDVIDIRLLYRERVLCAAGDHRHSVLIDPRELARVAAPRIADICMPTPGEHRFADVPNP